MNSRRAIRAAASDAAQ